MRTDRERERKKDETGARGPVLLSAELEERGSQRDREIERASKGERRLKRGGEAEKRE